MWARRDVASALTAGLLAVCPLALPSCTASGTTPAGTASGRTVSGRTVERGTTATGLAYERIGSGPVVVLIHGTNLDGRMWEDEVPWLARGHTVIRYDQRAHGRTPPPTGPFSNAEDLLALLDELDVRRAALVGLSGGAAVAVDVALAQPARVEALVLASPTVGGYRPERLPGHLAALSEALRAGDFERGNELLLDSPVMAVPPAERPRVRAMVDDASGLWQVPFSLVKLPSEPAIDRLAELRAPTLVLVGSDDMEMIGALAERLEREVPGARRVVVPGGGHLLNLTSPRAFREAVGPFLAGRDAAH